MTELTPEERKEVRQAFSKAMTLPLAASVIPGVLLNMLGPRTILVPIASLAIIVSGMIIAVVLGLKHRRQAIAAIEARRQTPTIAGAG